MIRLFKYDLPVSGAKFFFVLSKDSCNLRWEIESNEWKK